MRKRIRQRSRYSLFGFSVNLLYIVMNPYRLFIQSDPRSAVSSFDRRIRYCERPNLRAVR